MIFHTDTILVSCSHDKSIIFWELIKNKNSKCQDYYVAKDFLKINSPMYYIDIAVTQNRFICRKGRPEGKIKIIKFKNIKDLKPEMFTDDYYKQVREFH